MSRLLTWARAQPIVERLLALPPEQREQALARECGGDERLREKLERLLRAAERRSELFEPATGGSSSDVATLEGRAAPQAGDSIGPWRLVRSLGAGGMGEVWLVEREGADFRQRAALKLVKRGMDTDEVLARFRRERKVLAQLAHPAIPSLIDGGASDDGRPYVVMEFVEGAPLDAFVRERALDLPSRLRLFLRIGEAVQHAHERGVVHRDLKPSNVLVTGAGEPRLLDFGISKVLEGGDESHTLDLTLTGQQMLTPRYASPEQVQGREITAATDVYALGLILWELLVGKPAVSFDGLTQADFAETICERDVPRPSSAVEPNATALRRAIAGDLDTICAMALRKEPQRRYASVRQLCDDVQRHLDAQPVLARADTMTYRVSKFVRRNRLLVGATFGIMLALAVGLVIATVMFFRSEDARRLAEMKREDAEYFAYQAVIRGAYSELAAGNVLPDLADQPEKLRGWEWKHLMARSDSTSRVVWRTPGAGAIALCGRGRVMAVAEPNEVVLLDLKEDREIARIPVEFTPAHLALSPDADRLAIVRDPSLRVYSTESGDLLTTFESRTKFCHISFTPDGSELLGGHMAGALRLYSADCPERFTEIARLTQMCRNVDFSPDNTLLAIGGGLHDVLVMRWSDKKVLHRFQHPGNPQYVRGAVLLGDGKFVASVDNNGGAAIWDLATGERLPRAPDNSQHCMGIGARRDVDELVLIGNHLHLWTLATGDSRSLSGVHVSMRQLVVHPTEPLAYTTCVDGRVHEWDLATASVPTLRTRLETEAMALSPDGRRVALRTHTGSRLQIYDLSDETVIATRTFPKATTRAVGYSSSGDAVFVADPAGLIRLDSATLEPRGQLPLRSPTVFAGSSRDDRLHVALEGGVVAAVDSARMKVVREHSTPFGTIAAIAANASTRSVAIAAAERACVAFATNNLDDWRLFDLPPERRVQTLALSSDGRRLAAGGTFVSVYSTEDGELLFDRAGESTTALIFTRGDSRLLASAGRHLLVIHTGRWSLLSTFQDNVRQIHCAVYDPASESVLASDVSRDIRHYRAVEAPRSDAAR